MSSLLDPLIAGFLVWWEATLREVTPFVVRIFQIAVVGLILWLIAARLRAAVRRGLGTRVEAHTVFVIDRTIVLVTWVVIVAVGLALFGVDLTALAAGIGIATLALTLAMQDVLRNFIAGIYLLVEQPFRIGQRIKVREFQGVVQSVSVRVTTLRADDGAQVLVPNALLFSEAITNRGNLALPLAADQTAPAVTEVAASAAADRPDAILP
ncbi:MAG: mechanosensitive ion channel [Dehalococcoidia bacterium]